MYKKCILCKKNYVEEVEEELCLECDVFLAEEQELTAKYFDELITDSIDGDMLNDLGASLSNKGY